jgi:hypothetical protein
MIISLIGFELVGHRQISRVDNDVAYSQSAKFLVMGGAAKASFIHAKNSCHWDSWLSDAWPLPVPMVP